MHNLTKNQIISYLVDCKGYSQDDAIEMIQDGSYIEYWDEIYQYSL